MQRGNQSRHRMQRIGDTTAMSPGMQILSRARQRELETRQPAARHGQRRLVDAPHCAVGRQHDVRRKQLLVLLDECLEMTTADLLLSLRYDLNVSRQVASNCEESFGDLD